MVKVYTYRRLRERNRWLRSDGSPNFKDKIHSKPPELTPIMIRDPPVVSGQAKVLNACELMSKTKLRLVPVVNPSGGLLGVVTGMDIVDYLGGGGKFNLIRKHFIQSIYNVLNIKVEAVMNPNPLYVDVDTKVSKLLELMVSHGVGAVPILQEGVVKGIITERELMKFFSERYSGVKVREVMTESVIFIDSGSTLGTAMRLMVAAGIRRLPVLKDSKVIGMITSMDIVDFIGSHKVFKVLKEMTVSELNSLPLTEVMSREVKTVDPEADIAEAASLMLREGTDSLLVVNDKEEMLGIVTERDILYGVVAR